jgi:hypothetical protein
VSDKPNYFVDVYLNYVKQEPGNSARDLRVDILNIYSGMTTTMLKDEIDKIGDLIYQELVDKAGKENVIMERKEIHGRIIFF